MVIKRTYQFGDVSIVEENDDYKLYAPNFYFHLKSPSERETRSKLASLEKIPSNGKLRTGSRLAKLVNSTEVYDVTYLVFASYNTVNVIRLPSGELSFILTNADGKPLWWDRGPVPET